MTSGEFIRNDTREHGRISNEIFDKFPSWDHRANFK